jgi:hypothetical protein
VVEHAVSLSPERAGASAFLVDDGNALIFNRQLPMTFADVNKIIAIHGNGFTTYFKLSAVVRSAQ